MKLVIQNCLSASVSIDNSIYSKIDRGFLILVGFNKEDNLSIIEKMVDKLINIRVFNDENGKTNLSIKDIDGDILAVSQFTLYADFTQGRRPSFINAAPGEISKPLYEQFIKVLSQKFNKEIKTGVFGADMKVSLVNDGPFTSILDSRELIK